MFKPVLATLTLLLSVGLASADITVSGQGKITYTPDIGYINAGVSSDGKTAAEAWEKNAEVVKKIFDALKALGIEPKDMKTTNLNVSPKYDYPKDKAPVLIGYTASYDLNVTVRKLDDMGKLLDGMVDSGANRNMSVSFGCSDPEKLLDEARLKAVQEARKKAELYAAGAGCGLGLVQSINEGQGYVPVRYEFEAMAAPAAKDALAIAAGQQELSVTVTVVWSVNPIPSDSNHYRLDKPTDPYVGPAAR
jgi:uncharacterized protein YggE